MPSFYDGDNLTIYLKANQMFKNVRKINTVNNQIIIGAAIVLTDPGVTYTINPVETFYAYAGSKVPFTFILTKPYCHIYSPEPGCLADSPEITVSGSSSVVLHGYSKQKIIKGENFTGTIREAIFAYYAGDALLSTFQEVKGNYYVCYSSHDISDYYRTSGRDNGYYAYPSKLAIFLGTFSEDIVIPLDDSRIDMAEIIIIPTATPSSSLSLLANPSQKVIFSNASYIELNPDSSINIVSRNMWRITNNITISSDTSLSTYAVLFESDTQISQTGEITSPSNLNGIHLMYKPGSYTITIDDSIEDITKFKFILESSSSSHISIAEQSNCGLTNDNYKTIFEADNGVTTQLGIETPTPVPAVTTTTSESGGLSTGALVGIIVGAVVVVVVIIVLIIFVSKKKKSSGSNENPRI